MPDPGWIRYGSSRGRLVPPVAERAAGADSMPTNSTRDLWLPNRAALASKQVKSHRAERTVTPLHRTPKISGSHNRYAQKALRVCGVACPSFLFGVARIHETGRNDSKHSLGRGEQVEKSGHAADSVVPPGCAPGVIRAHLPMCSAEGTPLTDHVGEAPRSGLDGLYMAGEDCATAA